MLKKKLIVETTISNADIPLAVVLTEQDEGKNMVKAIKVIAPPKMQKNYSTVTMRSPKIKPHSQKFPSNSRINTAPQIITIHKNSLYPDINPS